MFMPVPFMLVFNPLLLTFIFIPVVPACIPTPGPWMCMLTFGGGTLTETEGRFIFMLILGTPREPSPTCRLIGGMILGLQFGGALK